MLPNLVFDQNLHCLLTEISMENAVKMKTPTRNPITRNRLILMIRMDKSTDHKGLSTLCCSVQFFFSWQPVGARGRPAGLTVLSLIKMSCCNLLEINSMLILLTMINGKEKLQLGAPYLEKKVCVQTQSFEYYFHTTGNWSHFNAAPSSLS